MDTLTVVVAAGVPLLGLAIAAAIRSLLQRATHEMVARRPDGSDVQVFVTSRQPEAVQDALQQHYRLEGLVRDALVLYQQQFPAVDIEAGAHVDFVATVDGKRIGVEVKNAADGIRRRALERHVRTEDLDGMILVSNTPLSEQIGDLSGAPFFFVDDSSSRDAQGEILGALHSFSENLGVARQRLAPQ